MVRKRCARPRWASNTVEVMRFDDLRYLTYWLNMDALTQTFSALADPTRRAILARLATGAATVGELAEPFDMSLPAVSRHLRVLTHAGLIERHAEAQWRRCEPGGEGFRAAAGWMGYFPRLWGAP